MAVSTHSSPSSRRCSSETPDNEKSRSGAGRKRRSSSNFDRKSLERRSLSEEDQSSGRDSTSESRSPSPRSSGGCHNESSTNSKRKSRLERESGYAKKEMRSTSRSSTPERYRKKRHKNSLKDDDRRKRRRYESYEEALDTRSGRGASGPRRSRSTSRNQKELRRGQRKRSHDVSPSRSDEHTARCGYESTSRRYENKRGGDFGSESEQNDDEKGRRNQTAREDAFWAARREERERRGIDGVKSVWGHSPTMREIHEVYEEYEWLEEQRRKEIEEDEVRKKKKWQKSEKEKDEAMDGGNGEKEKKPKKEKDKSKKKLKKHKKKKHSSDSGSEEEEWVEVTKEMREAEAAKEKLEEAAMIGPTIPEYLVRKEAALSNSRPVNYGKDMLRGEAAAMAAYVAQGKRIPRRGEIGLSSAEISEFEKIGYVMSGTRHKSMEATRLRKENQVMTAEEKRLLSGFTHDERKKKEEIVLQQFRSFIDSKKGKAL